MNPSWWGKNAHTLFNYNRFKAGFVYAKVYICIQSYIFVARVLHFSAFIVEVKMMLTYWSINIHFTEMANHFCESVVGVTDYNASHFINETL